MPIRGKIMRTMGNALVSMTKHRSSAVICSPSNEYSELRADRMLGEASLMSNWVHQHFYQAYLWMKGSRNYPIRAFRHELEALAWCEELVQASRADVAG